MTGNLQTLQVVSGPQLRRHREDAGWSAARMARTLGVTEKTIYNVERQPEVKRLYVLAYLEAIERRQREVAASDSSPIE